MHDAWSNILRRSPRIAIALSIVPFSLYSRYAHKARRMTDQEYLERLDRLPAIPPRSGTINTAVGVFMQRQTPSG